LEIILTASGTRGDVQPALALAYGLRDAGHQVRIIAGSNFTSWVESHGFTCLPTLDMEALMQSEVGTEWAEKGSDQRLQLKLMTQLVNQYGDELTRPLVEHGRDCDLHISGFTSTQMVAVIAEKHRIPLVEAALQPYRATRSGDATLISVTKRASIFNNLFGLLGQRFVWSVSSQQVNKMRVREGLQILNARQATAMTNRTPLVNGFSPSIVPHPEDWTPDSETAGYWFLDEHSDWVPPADLIAFLDAGSAPVYIGFGSMSSNDPRGLFDLTCEALRLSGQRAVFITGWSGLSDVQVPDNIYVIDRAPHSWLFDHVAGVVHHGGAGTTAAGLRLGKPTFIIPHMADQPFWGRRVYHLGAGPKPVPRPKLTAELLADGIRQLTGDAGMRRRAEALGAQIRAEDGVARGVEAIERFARKGAPRV
jgi:UDP:flavonoid glycosyltransferase YjiC (YdhE family)